MMPLKIPQNIFNFELLLLLLTGAGGSKKCKNYQREKYLFVKEAPLAFKEIFFKHLALFLNLPVPTTSVKCIVFVFCWFPTIKQTF